MHKVGSIIVFLLPILLAACGGGGGGSSSSTSTANTPVPTTTTVGTATLPAQTSIIGVNGGTLAMADGRLLLTVPAGALAGDTTLSVTPITNNAFGGQGTAYRLGPAGTTFSAPVTLTFQASATDLQTAQIGAMGVAYQDAEGYWNLVPGATINSTANTVSIDVTSLAAGSAAIRPKGIIQPATVFRFDNPIDFAPVAVALLRPLFEVVHVGNSQDLEVCDCYPSLVPTGPNGWRGYKCDNYGTTEGIVSGWAVHGTLGGDATWGTVVPSSQFSEATYTAPSQEPNPRDVLVSVNVKNVSTTPPTTAQIFADMDILGPSGAMNGTLSFNVNYALVPFPMNMSANVNMPEDFDEPDETGYTMKNCGSITISPVTYTDPSTGLFWKVQQASFPISMNSADFLVLKTPALAVRFSLVQEWDYTYTLPGGTVITTPVIFNFYMASGPSCIQGSTPTSNANVLVGSFDQICSPGWDITANWDLMKEQ